MTFQIAMTFQTATTQYTNLAERASAIGLPSSYATPTHIGSFVRTPYMITYFRYWKESITSKHG